MKAGSFIINGVNSEDIKTIIQSRPLLETPKRRVTFKQAYGQSGTTPYDEEAYDNTVLSLILFTEGDDAVLSREEIYDVFNSGSYVDLILYSDETKIYKVMVEEPAKFESRYYMNENQSYEIAFTVKPYKYLRDCNLITTTTSGIIVNQTRYSALPLIKVYATGDVTLTVNGEPFVIKDIAEYITLDSETMFAYKDTGTIITNENTKIYTRLYPFLKPGENTISWTGPATKVEILPRWRSLT